MAIQSAQITSLLGQVAEMLAQSKTTKGAERQRVETALATAEAYEKKKQIRDQEQRVLNQIGLRKGVLNYVQTTYLGLAGRFPPNPSKYPDMGTRAEVDQQISK